MDRFFAFAATVMMNQSQSQEQGAGFVAVSSFAPSSSNVPFFGNSSWGVPSNGVSFAAGPGLGKIPLHPLYPKGI